MTSYLLFTLAAPFASFGTVAVGERRPTWDRPSKSQTIGLVAGCFGIERRDDARQQALAASLGFAVRIDDPGQLATDYHTAQTPNAPRIRAWARVNGPIRTRADELAVDDLKTILSRREYRTGSCYTVCLWPKLSGPASLDEIKTAMLFPVFAPFAGRKANALMLPMRPDVVEAGSIDAALKDYGARRDPKIEQFWRSLDLKLKHDAQIFADADGALGQPAARLEERRDIPESRAKWRFGLRTEVLLGSTASEGDPA